MGNTFEIAQAKKKAAEEAVKAIERYYKTDQDPESREQGCYIGNKWLSVEKVADIIMKSAE